MIILDDLKENIEEDPEEGQRHLRWYSLVPSVIVEDDANMEAAIECWLDKPKPPPPPPWLNSNENSTTTTISTPSNTTTISHSSFVPTTSTNVETKVRFNLLIN